ncbi:hypothetical protein EJ110_NYTH29592 [Nymphaea thermarum]|nr:hypothetical protein EJ110_NYTH29592 [Nymphaea thermarum]
MAKRELSSTLRNLKKLNEEAEGHGLSQHHDASKAELSTDRGNGAPESESDHNVARTDSESDDEHKTKKPKVEMDMVNESQFTKSVCHSKPSNNMAGTSKQQSQSRLDWRVLRPPTGQNKQRS